MTAHLIRLIKIATEYNYSERTIRKLLKKKNEEE